MAEDQPQSQPVEASQPEAAAGQPADPGGPGDTTQATGQNPIEVAKETMKETDKAAEQVQAAATSGPGGTSEADVQKMKDDADAAQKALALQSAGDKDFANRLLDRQARRDGEEAMDALRGTTEKLQLDSAAGEEAHKMAQARAALWTAPNPIEGKSDGVSIVLHPEDPAERIATIHIRVLGEVQPDGFVTVYRDGADKNEVKEGRVAESPRFGTKNRVYAKGVNKDTGLPEGEVTYPGYFDWPPLRLNPGDYTAVVTTTAGKELATAKFTITGAAAEDLTEKNSAGPTGAQRAVIQSTQGARAAERQNALAAGTKLPDPLTEEDVLGDLVGAAPAAAGKKK
jgi:hypothetical protein